MLLVHNNPLADLYHQLPLLAFEDAGSALMHLTRDPAFLQTQILPHLAQVAPAREPYIAMTVGAREASTCLQIFVWPAGAATPIHDHTSWGSYQCVVGSLLEERYARLDDGEQLHTAHLQKLWRRMWTSSDGASTVRPYAGGIHRLTNLGSRAAISVHLYGPRTGILDGRDYDPTRDFVCDRVEISGSQMRPQGEAAPGQIGV